MLKYVFQLNNYNKRMIAVQKLVNNDAKTPHVALPANTFLIINQFGTHVQRGPNLGDFVIQIDVLQNSTEAKVGNFDLFVMYQNISGLQVSMHYIILIKHHKGHNDLVQKYNDLRLSQKKSVSH